MWEKLPGYICDDDEIPRTHVAGDDDAAHATGVI